MTKPEPEVLSAYLLREAEKFLFYPNRIRRTAANLGAQEIIDRLGRALMEWRKTFTPRDKVNLQLLAEPKLLDEFYCRDLLKSVQGVVTRTLALRDLTMPGTAEPDAVAYLREAANCYIHDLPQAAIALSRSALEVQVEARARRVLGAQAVSKVDLKELLDDQRIARLMDSETRRRAHGVRVVANRVLHGDSAAPTDALQAVEDTGHVLVALSR